METYQKYALITGATSGIGFELAKLFAHHNYNLVIVARSQEELDMTAIKLELFGMDVIKIAKDLFKRDEVFSLCDEIKKEGIEIDVLVNDAGQGVCGEFKDTDIERELNIVNLNICATVILTKYFVKDMISRGRGRILNLGSVADKVPGPWQSVYHATKAFVQSFTTAIREELKGTGVTLTSLMPAVTDTDFFNKAGMNESTAMPDKEAMAKPADVAMDGFNALMAGEDKVISGLKNKTQVNMSSAVPNGVGAHKVRKQQKQVENQ
jgi:short-subunit dehydrogenase